MSKNKLQKFAELKTFSNVFEDADEFRDRFLRPYRGIGKPAILELACGRGEYTLALAEKFPDRPVIGIDLKGARIWAPAKAALERELANVALLRTRIELIDQFFNADEVDQIWITFPDPYPKPCKAKKRLTSHRFLTLYDRIITREHTIHLKTDHVGLFAFSIESVLAEGGIILRQIDDLHAAPITNDLLAIQTAYEKRHLREGRAISYICFNL